MFGWDTLVHTDSQCSFIAVSLSQEISQKKVYSSLSFLTKKVFLSFSHWKWWLLYRHKFCLISFFSSFSFLPLLLLLLPPYLPSQLLQPSAALTTAIAVVLTGLTQEIHNKKMLMLWINISSSHLTPTKHQINRFFKSCQEPVAIDQVKVVNLEECKLQCDVSSW